MFSFNSPHGACPTCTGLGAVTEIDPNLVVPNDSLSIIEGCIRPLSRMSMSGGWLTRMFESLAEKYQFNLETPWRELSKKQQEVILYGDGKFEGVITNLKRRYKDSTSDATRRDIESYMNKKVCPDCNGARLKKEALAVTIAGKNIAQVVSLPINNCHDWFEEILSDSASAKLNKKEKEISRMILKEVVARLKFLRDVGLEYLNLSRSADTLSGGEAQRIRLATQIGSGLTGVLYILDEPSIGLHQRDNSRLLSTLKHLKALGNTVLVVEHDEETMRESDFIVDIGPKAGKHGGHIIAIGTPQEVADNDKSPTGRFLSNKDMIEVPKKRRSAVFSKKKSISIDQIEEDWKSSWVEEVTRLLKSV
jgi:excinuclease ABC subunit A